MPVTDRTVSISDHDLMLSPTETLKYSLMSQNPASLTWEKNTDPAPIASTSSASRLPTVAGATRKKAKGSAARPVAASVAADSPASRNMRDYLKGVEETLLSRGLLRTDDGSDIQLTPERLTDDFVLIALYDEYTRDGERLISRATPAPLRRWAQPVRLRIEFGDSVSSAQRARDRGAEGIGLCRTEHQFLGERRQQIERVVLAETDEERDAALAELLPADIDIDILIGRYIPNLVPRLFNLGRDFVEEIAALLWTGDLHGWRELPLRARLNLQAHPQALLPEALRDGNPLGLRRLVNGQWSDGTI